MNSIAYFHLATLIVCISILLRYTSSQPLSAAPVYEDDDRMVDTSSMIMGPSADVEFQDDWLPTLYLIHNRNTEDHRTKSSEPVRRANFWKRANFWRKRANFW